MITVFLFLFASADPVVATCEQWFIDTDRNPGTGYLIGGVGAEVILDVHGGTRTVFGGTGPGGWGGVIPATLLIDECDQFPLTALAETYECGYGCVSCMATSSFLFGVSYACEGHPRDAWLDTDKTDLHHMAVWFNCFGR